MVVADFTRFLCQLPELFRLVPGSLRRHAKIFCKPRGLLAILAAVGVRAHALGLLELRLRWNVVVWQAPCSFRVAEFGARSQDGAEGLIHEIHLPAAYSLRRTKDVLKGA
jgi:hypothetical protein